MLTSRNSIPRKQHLYENEPEEKVGEKMVIDRQTGESQTEIADILFHILGFSFRNKRKWS